MENELSNLNERQPRFEKTQLNTSVAAYKKELEHLAINLSWKSSQAVGNLLMGRGRKSL